MFCSKCLQSPQHTSSAAGKRSLSSSVWGQLCTGWPCSGCAHLTPVTENGALDLGRAAPGAPAASCAERIFYRTCGVLAEDQAGSVLFIFALIWDSLHQNHFHPWRLSVMRSLFLQLSFRWTSIQLSSRYLLGVPILDKQGSNPSKEAWIFMEGKEVILDLLTSVTAPPQV